MRLSVLNMEGKRLAFLFACSHPCLALDKPLNCPEVWMWERVFVCLQQSFSKRGGLGGVWHSNWGQGVYDPRELACFFFNRTRITCNCTTTTVGGSGSLNVRVCTRSISLKCVFLGGLFCFGVFFCTEQGCAHKTLGCNRETTCRIAIQTTTKENKFSLTHLEPWINCIHILIKVQSHDKVSYGNDLIEWIHK